MEATATRYSTTVLRSGKVAVVDNTTRRQVVAFIGTPDEADEFLAEAEAADYVEDEDGSIAFARYLEDRAANGAWFGRDAEDGRF